MATVLGKNQYPQGTKNSIQYTWNFGKFEIRTYEKDFVITDSKIVKKDDQYFFNPSKQNPKCTLNEIEIPSNIIERKDALNLDLKLCKKSIGSVNRKEGKIYFSLNSDGQLIARCGEKIAVADDIETIENRKAINVQSLGLEFPYIEVPAGVETAFLKAKYSKIMLNYHLIYAGKSLLTGKEYFQFNSEIPSSKWESVKSYFEYVGDGESGRAGELEGWVTSKPEIVEDILGIKTRVSDRKEEIDLHNDEVKKLEAALLTIER